MEWESSGVMGIHPGVAFGCHCSATIEAYGFAGSHGDAALDPDFAAEYFADEMEFELRYPRAKGRNNYTGEMPEGVGGD